MGKLSGILVGFSILSILEFFVLSGYYTPAENWLSPVFGPATYIIFGSLFFILGDPLNSTILIFTQIIVAVSIGVASRKGSRAVGAAIVMFTLSWAFIGLSVLYILSSSSSASGTGGILGGGLSLGGFSSFSSLLSAVPPGTNLASLINEPVINRIPYLLPSIESGILGGTGTSNIASSIESTLFSYAIYGIINFVVVVVIAGIVGLFVGRLIRGKRKEPSLREEKKAGPVPVEQAEKDSTTATLLVFLVAILLAVSALPFAEGGHVPSVNPGNNSYGAELANALVSSGFLREIPMGTSSLLPGSLGTALSSVSPSATYSSSNGMDTADFAVSPNGTIYTALGSIQHTQSSNPGGLSSATGMNIFGNASSSNSPSLGLMVTSSELMNLFYNPVFSGISSVGTGFNLSGLLNLVPPELLLLGYSTNASIQTANSAASSIFSAYGIHAYTLIFPFTGSFGLFNSTVAIKSLYIYGASSPFGPAMTNATKNIATHFSSTFVSNILSEETSNGWIIPGSANDSLGSSIYVAGFLNSSLFGNFVTGFPSGLNVSNVIPNGSIEFQGLFAANDFKISSSPGNHSITFEQLTGISSNLNFNSAGFLISIFATPGAVTNASFFPGLQDYQLHLLTNNLTLLTNTNVNVSLPGIQNGSSFIIGPSYVVGNITSRITIPVEIKTSLSDPGVNTVKVQTTIWNNGSTPIYNVVATSSFFSSYSSLITNSSGDVNRTVGTILPGSSVSFNATVTFKNAGIYYSSPVKVSYTYNNTSFARYSPSSSQRVGVPSMIGTYSQVFDHDLSTYLGPSFATVPILGISMFLGLFFLLIVVDIFFEYRAFKKWRTSRRV